MVIDNARNEQPKFYDCLSVRPHETPSLQLEVF